MEPKDTERIAVLESKLDTLTRIESKLDNLTGTFLPRNEAELRFKSIEKDMSDAKDNKRANGALIMSIITILVTIGLTILKLR
ncbi:hypothetical protein [Heyndrickxia acidicola]|uniref:Uncharacterized protein n=1 Tax=Heyndrickxia acidicola TaxID=209389 RepID=A0ABU6MMD7_9BACI|nr:hypothetical protein [Heyndrickxia acidicola]MED1205857.1 hypothetical protein [Heyndrickxia acidicola]